MKFSSRLAVGALVASLAAVPATAQAAPASAGSVRTEVRAADKSLDRVVSLVRHNRDSAASRELRRYRRSLRRAEGQTRRLRRSTDSVAGAKGYANAVRMVGLVSDECADSLPRIVDDAAGDPQVAIAKAISACIITRERVIEALTQRMGEVPDAAKPYIAKVIALLSTDGQDEVAGITAALSDTTLPTDVASILTQALELATAAIDDAIARLHGILGMVPAEVRPIVQGALTMVTDSLHMVIGMVKDLLSGLFGGVPTSPGTGTTTGILGGLFGSGGLPGLNLLQGIFGQAFPTALTPINLPFNVSGFNWAVR